MTATPDQSALRPTHRSRAELDGLLAEIGSAPLDAGEVQLIVSRPGTGERMALDWADLDTAIGLVGDNWFVRGSTSMPDGTANPEAQLTIMNARAADAVAGNRAGWALAGDQIYADLDLSVDNLPPGTRLRLGTAVVEISAKPHSGCAKFTQRFGLDAMRWANSDEGKALRLRGVNCRVIEPGRVTLGDQITKL